MTDNSPWESPSGSGPRVPPPSGGTPPPPPPAAFPPPPPPPPGWNGQPGGYGAYVPPPRPGLIPLGPQGLGGILGGSFRVLRRNPRPVVGVSLVIHLVIAAVNIAVTALFTAHALGQYFNVVNSAANTGELSASSSLAAASSLLLASAISLIGSLFAYAGNAILQGIITTEVARGTVGEKLPLSSLWARTRGRIGALLGWAGLVILVSIGALGIAAGLIAVSFAIGGSTGAILGGILTFVFVVAVAILGIWLSTKLSMVPSVLVIERLTIRRAMGRSWSLTRGYFWRTFGIELLVGVIVAIAASIIELPITAIVEVITAVSNPTSISQSGAAVGAVFGVTQVITEITSALVTTVTAIISTATTALIYIDLRMRKEGLDLSLMRYVDARAAGATDLPDPYLTPEAPTTPPTAPASPTL